MDDTQAGEQRLPLNQAWTTKVKDIDSILRNLLMNSSHSAYIQAASGAGKSTGLLMHALCIFKEDPAARVIYVVDSSFDVWVIWGYIDSQYNKSGIDRHDDVDPPNNKSAPKFLDRLLTLATYDQYIEKYREKEPLNEDLKAIVIADVPLRWRAQAEVFFSLLMEQVCDEPRTVWSCVFLAAHCSMKTLNTLDAVFESNLATLKIPDILPEIKVTPIGIEDFRQKIDSRPKIQSGSGTVILSVPDSMGVTESRLNSLQFDPRSDDPSSLEDGGYEMICFGPNMPSFGMPQVDFMVSSGTYWIKIWDTLSSQIATEETFISTADLELQKSWLTKAKSSSGEFYCLLPEALLDRLSLTGDPYSPSFNEDIMWTMLMLCHVNSNVFDMTIRNIPDCLAVQEVMTRLVAMGLVGDTGRGSGKYPITSRGECAVKLRAAHRRLDIHTATLLARARDSDLPMNVRRVMIRLGTIMMLDAHDVYSVVSEKSVRTLLHEIRPKLYGIGREQAGKGRLWIILGLVLSATQQRILGDPAADPEPIVTEGGSLIFDCVFAGDVFTSAQTFEDQLGIPPNIHPPEEVNLTNLSAEEVAMVEEQLVLSYMSRVVCVATTGDDAVYDAASNHPLEFDSRELLDLGSLKRDRQNQSLGAFFAIYLDLEIFPKSTKQRTLQARNLVYIPQDTFQVVEKACGTAWPDIIATSYKYGSLKDHRPRAR